jgi:hypothetical protein
MQIGWGHLKILSRITKPEKLRFTQKLPYLVQIQVCTNHGPQGSGGAKIGKTNFTGIMFILENNLQKSSPELGRQILSNLIQIILA